MRYDAAGPLEALVPSSAGAVKVTVALLTVGDPLSANATAAGGMVSLTVIVTVAVDVPAGLLSVYWNVTEPRKPVSGTYVKEPSELNVSVPLAGVVFEEIVELLIVSLPRTPGAETVNV